jgi:hypothetical protein
MEGAGTKLNLVLLAACRNNPFGGSATEGGLAQMPQKSENNPASGRLRLLLGAGCGAGPAEVHVYQRPVS